MGYLQAKAERDAALIRALHGIDETGEPAEPEGPPDFDGGVRQTPPLPSNPETDHDALVLQLLGEHRGGGAMDFWPVEPAKSHLLRREAKTRTGGRTGREPQTKRAARPPCRTARQSPVMG